MATITFDTLKFAERLEKAGLSREQATAIAEAQKQALAEAMDSQLAAKADLMEMENRLIKWGIGLALGQVAVIAALVKLL
ncbi:MAG: DUF1640 domain-containing protein [Thermodesulfobacteriota bacterium]